MPKSSFRLYQPAHDLFGEVPVSEQDLFDFVAAVAPRWLSPERSYRGYLRGYDVASKVRHAKIRGEFEALKSRAPIVWHARLALAAIN